MRTKVYTWAFLSTFFVAACGGSIQGYVDHACEAVARADDATAAALNAAEPAGVPGEYVDDYLVPVAETVVEAHDWCFAVPEQTAETEED